MVSYQNESFGRGYRSKTEPSNVPRNLQAFLYEGMTNIPNNLYQRSMKFGRTKRNGDKSDRKAVYNITFSNSVVTIPNTQQQAETILRTRVRIYVCIVYI